MSRSQSPDVMERIKNPRLKFRDLSIPELQEIFKKAWNIELLDGYIAMSSHLYGVPLLVLKFKSGRTISIKPDEITSMAKTQRLLLNSSLGYSKEHEIKIDSNIRPSIWKAACLAFIEDCRRVKEQEKQQLTECVASIESVNKMQNAIKHVIIKRRNASELRDCISNAYQHLFVMREPMVFDLDSNSIIVKRSNLRKYLLGLGDIEYTEGLNINDNTLLALALRGLGFNRVNMTLRTQCGRIHHNCALDVIDASLILENDGAVTDAAE